MRTDRPNDAATSSIAEGRAVAGAAADLVRAAEWVTQWPSAALLVRADGVIVAANAPARTLVPRAAEGADLRDLLGAKAADDLLEAAPDGAERLVGDDGASPAGPVLCARVARLGGDRLVVSLADGSSEARLRSHLERAERLASVGELLTSVAHELNNPLTTVLGYADLLLGEDDPSLPREELGRIRDAALRCRRIVANLLDLARADALTLAPVSLQQVVEHVVEFRAYAAGAAGVELRTEFDPSCAPVLGDFHRLVQAVLNLATNAEDAVRDRPAPRRLVLRTRALTGRVAIEVEDNGAGVPTALRERIFEPFVTTKPRGRGTGLGLSLVRGTAQAHGGEVRIDDAPGGGARFVLEIPAADPSVRTPPGDDA